MNLNFVNPPIPAGVQAYDPLITAENAGAELERIADWIETDGQEASDYRQACRVVLRCPAARGARQ